VTLEQHCDQTDRMMKVTLSIGSLNDLAAASICLRQ